MTNATKNSWSEQNDLYLAETVLKHLRNGKTETSAFEEAAPILKRSTSDCSIHWETSLEKRFEMAVKIAKKIGSTYENTQPIEPLNEPILSETISSEFKTIEKIEQSLPTAKTEGKKMKTKAKKMTVDQELEQAVKIISKHLKRYVEIEKESSDIKGLKEELQLMKEENEKLREENEFLKEEYKDMMKIFAKAKEMIS